MFLGYNTNGLAHHDLFDAIACWPRSAIAAWPSRIDHAALPPPAAIGRSGSHRLRRLLDELRMRSVIETGARFLLNPAEKHEPTLISATRGGPARRLDFYRYAIDCAAELGSDCVSLWSGMLRAAWLARAGPGLAR